MSLKEQAVKHLLDKTRDCANMEGWISEDEFFAKQI